MQNRDDQLLLDHLLDLAVQSERYGMSTFSDFLNLNEQTVFYEQRDMFKGYLYCVYGGYDDAERQIVQFYQPYCSDEPYPIVCVCISPVSEKFSEHLTHRDFLGAVLNLGIERCKTGDILIKEHTAYMFCKESIAAFICEHLITVKHTKIRAKIAEIPAIALKPELKTKQGTVTSVRIDSIVALAFNLSRSQAGKYISQKLVFINGRQVDSNSRVPKDGDLISVRGIGRFKLELTAQKSKKDKYVVKTHIYI